MSLLLDGTLGVPVTTVTGTLPVANGGTGVTSSTGSGAVVLGTSPTLATPTFNSAQLATVSGTAPLYMARTWVNFAGLGTATIIGSGNVSSVTDISTGDWAINFTTAMSDANYIVVGTVAHSDNLILVNPINSVSNTTSGCRVSSRSGNINSHEAATRIGVVIFR